MSSSSTIHVQGISSQTSEKEVRDFFSFCGQIETLSLTPTSDAADASKSASVTFVKDSAAKTALLLDNTQLGPSQVHVTAAANLEDLSKTGPTSTSEHHDDDHIPQEEKPRARIIAEYLAHGYTISDNAIQRAITLDQKHGFSSRFTQALSSFDSKYKATEKARSMDTSYGISAKANAGWQGLNSYFEKAIGTPTGQKLRAFYIEGDKQVREVHSEARRLADLKAGKTPTEKNEPETVAGTDKTVCKCAGDGGNCPCEPGKCACATCPKSSAEAAEEVEKAAGAAATKPTEGAAPGAATTT
ncbi:MAG: hypothetical protein Q9227_007410 [Pyrenula ochraceoflavens]